MSLEDGVKLGEAVQQMVQRRLQIGTYLQYTVRFLHVENLPQSHQNESKGEMTHEILDIAASISAIDHSENFGGLQLVSFKKNKNVFRFYLILGPPTTHLVLRRNN